MRMCKTRGGDLHQREEEEEKDNNQEKGVWRGGRG